MSLTNRVSLFFLASLAIVLAGFSAILYALATRHLNSQLNQRLNAAMQTLVAAIEIHPDNVEWEPLERKVTLGEDPAVDQVRWMLHDSAGRLIDCSSNLTLDAEKDAAHQSFRMLVRRVRAGCFDAEPLDGRAEPVESRLADASHGSQAPGEVVLHADRTFHGDALVITVAAAEAPQRAILTQLGWTLAAVSAAIWLTAAVWGRWLCRRALIPITRMAGSARLLHNDAESGKCLDVPASGDELEDLGRAFNDLLSSLRESLDRQQRFTADASHQLRTPLTALLASVEVALKKERTPSEYLHVLDVVKRRGTQLRQIIESLLFLARSTVTTLPEAEAIDLSEWCRGWLASWADHPRAHDLVLDAEAAAPTLTHPAMLGQVLDNFLDNACKYSEPGTEIVLAVKANEKEVFLTVSDSGLGIVPEELPRVFEPFFRSANARWLGKPGLGLGLAVVWRLAALLGGRVTAGSEIGRGSWFRLSLPRAAEKSELALVDENGQICMGR